MHLTKDVEDSHGENTSLFKIKKKNVDINKWKHVLGAWMRKHS